MTLKSRSELLQKQAKAIDLMDVNQVIEVPDTPPDRLTASTHDTDQKTSKEYINGRIRNQQKTENVKPVTVNGNRRLFIHQDNSTSFKHPKPSSDTTRHEKGKSLCNSDVPKFTFKFSGVNASTKSALPLKSCKQNTTLKNDKGESSIMQPCTSSKVPHKRMLVRNGCISPHNIAKSKHVSKNHETGNLVKEVVKSGSSSSSNTVVDIKDLISEEKDSHRCNKGKGVSSHTSECNHLSHRRITHNHRQKEKEGTPLRNLGKRSVSFIDVDDSNVETSSSRSKRNKNVNGVGPSSSITEPITCDNEDSGVRVFQVEADEMLARELQEQLYNEELTPVLPATDELDFNFTFTMPAQLDSTSRHAGGRRVNSRQATSALNTSQPNTSRQRRLQPQNRTSTRMSQLRAQFRSRPQTISSNSIRRNSIFPPNMDVDMRMQILETLEEVGDTRRPNNNLSRIRRDFNEGDYEMLLALDDDNHRHGGATRAQINNLPESKVVQAENLQECSICLETPTIGETIRHLPCLHRFHKACIDPWLRRKTSCPVCKSSIT